MHSAEKHFKTWELDQLINYIIVTHHSYIKDNVEPIIDLSQKLIHQEGHFEQLPEAILRFFNQLIEHLKKEEEVLFPKINQLMAKKKNHQLTMGVPFGFIKNGTLMMQMEHEVSIDFFKFVRSATNNYTLPSNDPQLYYQLFEKLRDFEEDLVQHMHLESTVLFPKATALEDALAAKL